MWPMMIVGLTGGIGSGKSTVSAMVAGNKGEYPIVDADLIARSVVRPGKPAYNQIVKTFGPDILLNGTVGNAIDRAKLGSLIFADDQLRKRLNSCTHPHIIRQIWWDIFIAWITGRKIVFLDAPLLIEAGLSRFMTHIIVVYVPKQIQLERLLLRNKETSEVELRQRIESQMSIEEKRGMADTVIDNTGTVEETRVQVDAAVDGLSRQWKWFALKRLSLILILPAIYYAFNSRR